MFPDWDFTSLSSTKALGNKEQKANTSLGKRPGKEKKKNRQELACSYGREGEESENKKEGGDKTVEKEYEWMIMDFLTHL